MSKGYEAIRQALELLGYDPADSSGKPWRELWSKAPTAFRTIYTDLYRIENGTVPETLPDPQGELALSDRAVRDILPLGIAMLVAQLIGNDSEHALFASLYAQKRASLSGFAEKPDVLPVTAGL